MDFETSGFGVATGKDVPLDLAYCVLDGQCNIIREKAVLLNWTTVPGTDARLLKERVDKVASAMGGGRQFSATWERMLAEGVPALEGAHNWLDSLNSELREGRRLGGTNLIGFDMPILCGLAEAYEGFSPGWNRDDYHDVGMIEKGVQLGVMPYDNEQPADYYRRIQHGGKVKWNLHDYCRTKYGITDHHWFANHGALSDCRLVARVLKHQLIAGGILA